MKKRYPFLSKTWLRLGLSLAFATALVLNLQAQTAPVKQWDKTFGGTEVDGINSLQQTADGGFILGCGSGSGINGDKSEANLGQMDYWIVKTDANGNKLWDKTFGGNDIEGFTALRQTADGGYILGGYSSSGIGTHKSQSCRGGWDYWIVKIDASGNKQWDKTFGGTQYDYLFSLEQTTDGGYILGGYSNSGISGEKSQFSSGSYDYWIVKTDASGNKLWDKTYGSLGTDNFFSCLKQTADGGYLLGGYTHGGIGKDKSEPNREGLLTTDYWIIKLDAAGNKSWDKTLGGIFDDALTTLVQLPDGGYLLGGNSLSGIGGDKTMPSNGNIDFWLVRLNGAGVKLWDAAIGGNHSDWLNSMKQTSDGGFLLGGQSMSGIGGDKTDSLRGQRDMWVVKIGASGNKLWDKTFGGTEYEYLSGLQQTADGGIIIGGGSDSPIGGDKSQICKGTTDAWVIKLGPEILGVDETKPSFNLSIFPNPSHGKFHLRLNNLSEPAAEIAISDLLGRVLLQKEIKISDNQLSEEITLPNTKGLYLLQFKAGDEVISRKIVVE